MRKILFYLGRFISFLLFWRKMYFCSSLITIVRSGYYSKFFKHFGSSSRIMKGGYYNDLQCISIGEKCVIGENVALTAWSKFKDELFTPEIIIGDNVSIGFNSHITAINKIVIGNNVLMGKNVLITDNSHGQFEYSEIKIAPSKRSLYSKGEVIIDDNVWIGDKASILSGVHIGYGSIIAANAVVTKDIPPLSIAAGVPAVIVKKIKNNLYE